MIYQFELMRDYGGDFRRTNEHRRSRVPPKNQMSPHSIVEFDFTLLPLYMNAITHSGCVLCFTQYNFVCSPVVGYDNTIVISERTQTLMHQPYLKFMTAPMLQILVFFIDDNYETASEIQLTASDDSIIRLAVVPLAWIQPCAARVAKAWCV